MYHSQIESNTLFFLTEAKLVIIINQPMFNTKE